jgi:hypothetical protein
MICKPLLALILRYPLIKNQGINYQNFNKSMRDGIGCGDDLVIGGADNWVAFPYEFLIPLCIYYLYYINM